MNSQPISELFLHNIDVLPLWVKQVLYLKTRDKLREELAEFLDVLVTDNLMQYYVPKLTFAGRTELETREKRLPEEFYTFYKCVQNGNDLFEITLANYWTFTQTCSLFVRSIELQYVNIPENESIISIAQFMAGKIRTGEMLKRLGKIDVMQLEKAIRVQKERNEQNKPVKMAELMIELGYITEKDVKILLAFKDDAKKRFVMGIGFSLVKPRDEQETQTLVRGMQKEIKRLDEENRILKSRLRKILNIKE
ncbi:TPA: hypothetical protein IAA92_06665 [Candidatus Galligastranaerophilus intestinigallinarum]|nr:hypothetical protein [Candidatus Galligastranaerophilus intestinigallinarum]